VIDQYGEIKSSSRRLVLTDGTARGVGAPVDFFVPSLVTIGCTLWTALTMGFACTRVVATTGVTAAVGGATGAAGAASGATIALSVCGMAVEAGDETTTLDGLTLRFCSSQCRATFVRAPERYLGASVAKPTGVHLGVQ